METINTYYDDCISLEKFVRNNETLLLDDNNSAVMVQIFSGICDKNHLLGISKQVRKLIPGAQVIGTTTSGEIMNGLVSGLKTVMSFSVFHRSKIRVAFAEMKNGSDYELGQSVAATLNSDKARILILFTTGPTLNAAQLLKGVQSVNAGLPVAGGGAGSNRSGSRRFVCCNENVTECGVVGIVLESSHLIVSCHSHLGWQPIGKEMTITRAEGMRIYTIDNKPAFQVYRQYLGIDLTTDIMDAVEFPLIISKHGLEIARSPGLRYEDDSIGFFGDVAEGDKARFSFGHVEMIIEKMDDLLLQVKQQSVESIFVYSCTARRGFLQESAQIETLPLQDIAPTAGFFTSGEFFHADNSNQLLNATMTTLVLSESDVLNNASGIELEAAAGGNNHGGEIIKNEMANRNLKVMKGLTNLINTVTGKLNEKTTELETANQALHLSEERFSKAFLSNPDPICITTLKEGRYIEINDAWVQHTGYNRSEALGRTADELGIWSVPGERDLILKQIMEQGSIRNVQITYRTKSGTVRTYLVSIETIDMDRKPHLIFVCKDITEQRAMEERLRESEVQLRSIYENANGIILTVSPEGIFIFISHGWTRLLGHDVNEVEGHSYKAFIHPDDIGLSRDYLKYVIATGDSANGIEFRAKHKNGTWRWVKCNGSRVVDEAGNILYGVGIAEDITERKQAEAEIRYLSYHDKLTGLYNRTFFEEELQRINTERQLPIVLIMGDLNGLKLINDALGHQEGDQALIKTAEILRNSCRHEDIISRWGGDEFIILLPQCDSMAALTIIRRIKDSVIDINNLPVQISISLGMAIQNRPDQDIKEVIREAEEKMYRNKLLESRSARSSFIKSLEKTLWERSHETEAHCLRMQEMAQIIGNNLELSDSELDNLKLLAALHDIGKIAVPNNILDKPGKLTAEEWESIKNHSEIGYHIALSSPELAPIAEAILHHHEWWDGSGYPLGLKGGKIPLISRIIAITDAYDVMINGRPYKKAVSKQKAIAEIERCAGTQFDPELVRKFFLNREL